MVSVVHAVESSHLQLCAWLEQFDRRRMCMAWDSGSGGGHVLILTGDYDWEDENEDEDGTTATKAKGSKHETRSRADCATRSRAAIPPRSERA